MDTFTYTPSFTSSGNAQPRIRSAQFDEGFESAEPDGQNVDLRVWTLLFANEGSTDLAVIDQFLINQGGAHRFLWTPPPPLNTQRKVICEDWNWTYLRGGLAGIQAIFMERP
jgi:phage-related protein